MEVTEEANGEVATEIVVRFGLRSLPSVSILQRSNTDDV